MSISPRGWLALLISLGLHGVGAALLYLLTPASDRPSLADLPQFVHAGAESSMTAFIVGERTEVIDVPPNSEPIASVKIEDPKLVGPSVTPNSPGLLAESIKTQVGPVVKPGTASGRMGVTQGGSGATTSFFNVPAKAQRIVYLIDHSASMGPSGALEVAGQELLASLGRLPAGTRFQIIVYNRTANLLMPRYPDWLEVDAAALKQVVGAWNDLPAEGGTDHARALKLALSLQPEVVFFLTDAGDVRADALRDITRLNQGRTAIHVIELNVGRQTHDDGPLQRLAHENRGTFQPVLVH